MKKAWVALLLSAVCSSGMAQVRLWWRCDDMPPGGRTEYGKTFLSNSADPKSFSGVPCEQEKGSLTGGGARMPEYRTAFPDGYYLYDPLSDSVFMNNAALHCGTETGGANGRSGCVTLADEGLYGDVFTLEFFLRCDKQGDTWETFLTRLNESGETSFYLRQHKGGLYSAYSYITEDNGRITAQIDMYNCYRQGDLLDENWHHVALAVDQKSLVLKLYVDYQLARTVNMPGRMDVDGPGTLMLGIGTETWGGNFSGLFDEVRVTGAMLEPGQFLQVQQMDRADVIYHVGFGEVDGMFTPFSSGGNKLRNHVSATLDVNLPSSKSWAPPSELARNVRTSSAQDVRVNADAVNLKRGYLKCPCLDEGLRTGDFTIETMFRLPEEVGNVQYHLINHRNGVIVQCVNRKIQVKDPGWKTLDEVPVPDGKWHHLAYAADRTNGKLYFYFDYSLVGVWDVGLEDFADDSDICIGAYYNGGQSFPSIDLDETRISRGVKTVADFVRPAIDENGCRLSFSPLDFTAYGFGFGAFSVTRDGWGQGYSLDGAMLPGPVVYDGAADYTGVPNTVSAGFSGSNYGGAYIIPDRAGRSFSEESFTSEMFACVTGYKFGATDKKCNPTFIGQSNRFRVECHYWDSQIAAIGPDGKTFATFGYEMNRWYHLAYVQDAENNELRFYVNRKLIAVKRGIPEPAGAAGGEIYVMGSPMFPHLGTFLAARADEIRLSVKALSPSEFLSVRRRTRGTEVILR